MAMSMRGRGGAGAGNRGRTGVRPVYEEFKPVFEWKYEEGANILLCHLPGFVKEQIRILAESKGILKVRGESFVGGNKWKRFQEEVVVPEDCNMSEIRAKFEGGILRIIMPKKIKTTQDNISTNAPNPIRNPVKPENDHTSNAQDTVRHPTKPVLDHQTNINAPNPVRNPTKPEHDHTTTNTTDTIKSPPTKPVYDHNTNAPNPIRNPTKPEYDQTSSNAPDPIKTDKVKPSAIHDYEPPKASMPNPQTRQPQQAQKMEEDGKHKAAFDYHNNSENAKEKNEIYEEDYKRAYNKVTRKMEEDRQLLVNMGVAVLVIMGLGAYMSYSFGSPT